MTRRDRVTIVIPTYNRASLLPRALASALANCLPGDEVLVVDDGSRDDTPQVLARYGPPVRVIRQRNSGAGVARNRGILEARNPIVAFLDSDDEMHPCRLALQGGAMAAIPDALFCFADFSVRDEEGRFHPSYLPRWTPGHTTWEAVFGPSVPYSSLASLPPGIVEFPVRVTDLYPLELVGNYVLTSSLVFRREGIDGSVRFAEDLPVYEDKEFFARLARLGKGVFLERDVVTQHGHLEGRLTDVKELEKAVARLTILDRVWGSDPSYLSARREEFREERNRSRDRLLMLLLKMGSTAEARRRMAGEEEVPASYRLLASLPEPAARAAVAILRSVKRAVVSP